VRKKYSMAPKYRQVFNSRMPKSEAMNFLFSRIYGDIDSEE